MYKRFLAPLIVAVIIAFTACATLYSEQDKVDFRLDNIKEGDFLKPVASTLRSGFTPYDAKNAALKTEWFWCQLPKATKGQVALLSSGFFTFSKQTFCQDWLAQVFLSQGYGPIGVNAPGYGKAAGSRDLYGKHTVAAVRSTLLALASLATRPAKFIGLWAFGEATIGAALVGQTFKGKGLDWILLGAGIFDLEQTAKLSKDTDLKTLIAKRREIEKDRAFEDRSIAYDPVGLPANIGLYAGERDDWSPRSQSESFRATLATGGYKVWFEVIPEQSVTMSPAVHQRVIDTLLQRLPASKP